MPVPVAIARCDAYETPAVKRAVSDVLSSIGNLTSVVKPGDRVLLKINHLGRHGPETAINTHPKVLHAVVELVREITSNVVVADGLGSLGNAGFADSGTLEACRDLDVELLNLKGHPYREVRRDDFECVEAMPVAERALDADVVITLPKLKTHMLCLMTNAVKNNYGFLPHRLRINHHLMFKDPDVFSNLVVDTFVARKPDLAIVDAIEALEGTGPSRGGTPRRLGLVLAGRDCVAVDAVSAAVMGLEPTDVASTRHAVRRGLGEGDLAKIDVRGERVVDVRETFRLPANRMFVASVMRHLPAPLMHATEALMKLTLERPRIVTRRCIACGLCVKNCPAGAIRMVDGRPVIDDAKCVACFCCQEFCESDAIAVTRGALGQTLSVAARSLRRIRRAVFGRRPMNT